MLEKKSQKQKQNILLFYYFMMLNGHNKLKHILVVDKSKQCESKNACSCKRRQ